MKKAMKKLMAMGLATVLLAGAMTAMIVSADTTDYTALNTELIVNGDFSDGAAGWTLTKQSGAGGSIKVENEKLRINSTSTVDKSLYAINYWNYQVPVSGKTIISGKINIESISEGARVVIGCNHTKFGDANKMGEYLELTTATNGWVPFEVVVDGVSNKDDYLFFIRVYGTALVWVDDTSIQHKERLLASGQLGWRVVEGKLNFTHGYTKDEAYVGPEVTPYSGDDCFYQWGGTFEGTKYSAVRICHLLDAKPVIGETYRVSMRFKPKEENATYVGPRMEIVDWQTYSGSGRIVSLNKDCWTVENVTSDGWKEISAYFTMPEYTATNLGLKIWAYYGGWIDDLMIERDCDRKMEIMSANFEPIDKAAPGAAIKMKAHIVSDKTAAEGGRKVKLVLARYAKVGDSMQCVEIRVSDDTVNAGTAMTGTEGVSNYTTAAKDIRLDYVIPADAAGQIIKAFLWDGTTVVAQEVKGDSLMVTAN